MEQIQKNLSDLVKREEYRFIKGDISDSKLVQEIIKDVDTIINFSAETHVDRSIADSTPFIQSNIIGIFTLLVLLIIKMIRFILLKK